MADRDRVKEILRLEKDLRSGRDNWLQTWEDLGTVMMPRVLGFTTEHEEGDRRTDLIFDGTPMQAARGLANAIGGMARPAGEQWIFMEPEGDRGIDELGKFWIAEAEEILIKAITAPEARLRQATGEVDLSLVVLGSAVIFAAETADLGRLQYMSVPLSDAVTMRSESGVLTGVLRRREFKLRQLINRFGIQNLSAETRELARSVDNLETKKITVVHAVLPRDDAIPDGLFRTNLPIADLWIEERAEHLLEAGGYHEMPFVAPRWDTTSGEDYGRSPGMIALPDSQTLQAMGETILMAGQRAADPPMAVPSDGAYTEYNTVPGGLLYYDLQSAQAVRGNPIFPLQNQANIPLSREMQTDIREQVWAAFLRNILRLPVGGPEMTATEIIERKEEFLREIGPVFGHYESDMTGPLVERTFGILLRAGAFPPIPESLRGKNIRFRYASPVAKARAQIEYAAAQAWVAERVELAQVDPEAMDAVNLDAYADFGAEANNVPHRIVNPMSVRQEKRDRRRQALEAQQRAEQQQQAADTAVEAAKTPVASQLIEQAQQQQQTEPA